MVLKLKCFSTLASATTSHLNYLAIQGQRFDDKGILISDRHVHNMQFDRLHTIYKKNMNL